MQASTIARRGLMLVLSSPSGAGKTTLAGMLLDSDDEISMSVSVTTRPARPGEIDGKHYHFISEDEFARMREAGDLLESAEVFGNYYGTPREAVERELGAGRDVLFDIDWQGAQQLRANREKDFVSVFVLPPSGKELEARLRSRAQDSDEVVARRMAGASNEISHWAEYDYIIVNDDIDRSIAELQTIVRAERLKRERQIGLFGFVRDIVAGL